MSVEATLGLTVATVEVTLVIIPVESNLITL
jgi:hypothetical protein